MSGQVNMSSFANHADQTILVKQQSFLNMVSHRPNRRHSSSSLNVLADDFDPHASSPHHIKPSPSRPEALEPPSISHNQPRLKSRSSRSTLANDFSASQAPLQANGSAALTSGSVFDPLTTVSSPLPAAATVGPVAANPYSHDATGLGAAGLGGTAGLGGAAFFANQTDYQRPV